LTPFARTHEVGSVENFSTMPERAGEKFSMQRAAKGRFYGAKSFATGSLPKFIAIAACDPNGVIGNAGKLPWHYPEDLEHFYRSTEEAVMVMGYNTFCSLPARAFVGRTCLVLTRNHEVKNAISLRSLAELETYYRNHPELLEKPNFVIGGAAIFTLFFAEHLIELALITEIHKDYEGDVKFPLDSIVGWHKKTILAGKEFSIILYTRAKHGS